MDTRNAAKLPFRLKFGYGASDGAQSAIWILYSLYFLYFLTDIVKLDPAIAGSILLIGTIWDAINDPLVGIWSDNTRSKWGRRRPFIIGVVVPFSIFTWLLFTDFGLAKTWTIVYFIVMVILYDAAYTILCVPYSALAAEMTQDYNERTSIMMFRAIWSNSSNIIAAATALLIANYFGQKFGSIKVGWSVMAAIFAVLMIFPNVYTWHVTRGYELFPKHTHFNLKEIIMAVIKNRPFFYAIGLWLGGEVGTTVGSAVMIYFMTYHMGFAENQSSLAFLLLFGSTLIWIPLINLTSSKIGKKWAFIIYVGLWAILMGIGVILVKPENVIFFYILTFFVSSGVVGVYLIGYSIMADVVEVDEFKTGKRREGVYFGLMAFVQKIGSAFALWAIGLVLHFIGYVPNVPQTTKALWGIRILYAEGTTFFLIIGIIACYLMPITKDKHQALVEAIKLKKENKKYDVEAFKDLL